MNMTGISSYKWLIASIVTGLFMLLSGCNQIQKRTDPSALTEEVLNQSVLTKNPERVVFHKEEADTIKIADSLWGNRRTIAFEFKLSEEALKSRIDLLDCPLLHLTLGGNFIWPEFAAAPTPEGERAERIQFAFFNPEQWYHLTVCWDGPESKMRLYLNGELQQLAYMRRWTDEQFSGPLILGSEHITARNITMFNGFATEQFVKEIIADLDLTPLSGEGREVYTGPMETDNFKKKLVYEANFNTNPKIVHEKELFDNLQRKKLPEDAVWVIEGRATAETREGKMIVINSSEGKPDDNHAVLWNTKIFPENFLLEFEMTPKDPGNGLAIIFFCSTAKKTGGSVFEEHLPKREGDFGKYNRGAINCYHTSYWASSADGSRLTTNLRKNYGFELVALGDENIASTTMNPEKIEEGPFKVRLMKVNNQIQVETRGQLVLKWEDDGQRYGPVYGAGQIGLRQMGHAGQVSYHSFKVYEIIN